MTRVVATIMGLAVATVAALVLLAGCSSPTPIDVESATVIDVRTPDEYAQGHLDGAINLDVQASDFSSQIADLARDGRYVVYCRSGVRAGTAVALMTDAGFTDVVSAGGMQAASQSTGLEIVAS
ncbi:MAG: rhodanese-like domain-containing protein [Propionibacteriaceae bacterium]|nr:rhodanese-like domain-containing protein [Propionibacteriaceae bacterium]